jgi:ribulose-5-phosphate 4-epimerase/fuculose-1-phosphate aldolase
MATVLQSQANVRPHVTDEEWQIRVDLAAAYRLVALYGWDDLIYTHISARVPGPDHHFLINPMGLLFEEITASNLVKIDLDGSTLMETPYSVNKAGFVIHSAIHAARADAGCVLHLHTDHGVAVSCLEGGLERLTQTACFPLASLAYHDYEGVAVREDEKARLVANLGDKYAMILRNHGTLTVGKTVGDAFHLMYFLERACRMQILAQSTGHSLVRVSDEAFDNAVLGGQAVIAGAGELGPWPALRRKLDRIDPGYQE